MAQLDSYRRYSEASRSQGNQHTPNSSTPRAQTSSPTFQQLLQGEASLWSPGSSPKLRKHVDHEEDHNPHNRKSVLAKVKDRARKLRHSLSGKKHHQEHNLYTGNTTPSWGVRLEDYEDEEEDPEYLGAPMYESELAPANYKETAKQHPREIHGVPSEKHVVASSVNKGVVHEKEEHLSPNKTMTETMSEKLGPAYAAVSETVSEKLAPAYAAVSDATQNVANKIASLTVSTPEETEAGVGNIGNGIDNRSSLQIWDKGVSVKEYLMQKFEPGEDEKALSQVISETISPRRTTGDMGMVEKMKGAVSSFLWPEEPSQASMHLTKSSMDIPNSPNANTSSPILVSTTKPDSSSPTSLSPTNASTTKTSSSSQASLSHTNASTTKTSSPSGSSLPRTNASTINVGSSTCTSLSPTNASTTKRSSSSHTSISPPNASGTKTSSSSHTSLSPTNASTTKEGSSSSTSFSPTNASTTKSGSSSYTSQKPSNASTTKTSSSSRTSLSPANASTTKSGSSSYTSQTPSNAPTTKTSSSSRTSLSPTYASITKADSSSRTPLSLTNASSTKAGSSSHTSLTPTNASTTKISLLPHISTISAATSPRSAISKRSLSAHAPVSTSTTTSATKTSSSTNKPFSTTCEKSSTQIPVSTYVTEVIEEENHGRVLQAN